MCPSSHRSEDLLPYPEVSWNLRQSRMSFLPSLFLLPGFPALWASCHFHCAGFSSHSHSASTTGAFADLGFCCAWPLPHRSQDKVVSARLTLRNGTRYVGGVCDFLSSVLPQQKFEMVDQCYSSVTAQFYLLWTPFSYSNYLTEAGHRLIFIFYELKSPG